MRLFARLLSQAHMLKINRDHRARLVSSNRENFRIPWYDDTILFLYAGDIRGASWPRVPAYGQEPCGGNKVPYFQLSPDTRHQRVQHKGHASLACLADALNLLYNKWFRRVRGPAATQATRHLWYVNYFTHLILVTWVWAACGYAGYLWLNDLFHSALPSENDVYVPPTRRTDCVVTNQQNTLTDVDTMSVSSTRRVFTLSHALTHSEPIDRPSDAISDSPTRTPLVAGYNAALSSISCSFQKHIYILSSFQRCATVFKSMALVSFRSTNKAGSPRIR